MSTQIKDIYSGDPKLILLPDGATLSFTGGQPVMDQGFENFALISLFTEPGWAGNSILTDIEQQIGSGFMEATRQPITLQSLNDIRNEAEKALKYQSFGNVTVTVTNPRASQIDVRILIEPPGQDSQELLLTKDGLNWLAQSLFPANREI